MWIWRSWRGRITPPNPFKGDCSYYSIPAGGRRSVDAVWTYESPYPAVAQIKDHLAFYPDRVDGIEARPAH